MATTSSTSSSSIAHSAPIAAPVLAANGAPLTYVTYKNTGADGITVEKRYAVRLWNVDDRGQKTAINLDGNQSKPQIARIVENLFKAHIESMNQSSSWLPATHAAVPTLMNAQGLHFKDAPTPDKTFISSHNFEIHDTGNFKGQNILLQDIPVDQRPSSGTALKATQVWNTLKNLVAPAAPAAASAAPAIPAIPVSPVSLSPRPRPVSPSTPPSLSPRSDSSSSSSSSSSFFSTTPFQPSSSSFTSPSSIPSSISSSSQSLPHSTAPISQSQMSTGPWRDPNPYASTQPTGFSSSFTSSSSNPLSPSHPSSLRTPLSPFTAPTSSSFPSASFPNSPVTSTSRPPIDTSLFSEMTVNLTIRNPHASQASQQSQPNISERTIESIRPGDYSIDESNLTTPITPRSRGLSISIPSPRFPSPTRPIPSSPSSPLPSSSLPSRASSSRKPFSQQTRSNKGAIFLGHQSPTRKQQQPQQQRRASAAVLDLVSKRKPAATSLPIASPIVYHDADQRLSPHWPAAGLPSYTAETNQFQSGLNAEFTEV